MVQILLSASLTRTSFAPFATCSLLSHFLLPSAAHSESLTQPLNTWGFIILSPDILSWDMLSCDIESFFIESLCAGSCARLSAGNERHSMHSVQIATNFLFMEPNSPLGFRNGPKLETPSSQRCARKLEVTSKFSEDAFSDGQRLPRR